MRTEDFDAFVRVAQSGSFSAAARMLHLTQPAVSKRIQRLEANLAATLFDRVGKRVFLTDAGRLLLPRAQALLAGFADTTRALANLTEKVVGSLKLATSHHVGLHRLAPILRSFSRAYPEVRLDIRFEDSEAAHGLVLRGESELAVVTLDPIGLDPVGQNSAPQPLTYMPLWDDPLCFVVAADHPLADAGRLNLSTLAAHPVILPGLATYTGRIVAGLFEARGIPLTATLSTNFLETISMLVGIGLGWSVLPSSMLTKQLIGLEVDAPPIGRVLGCVTNPHRTLTNAASAFVAELRRSRDPGPALSASG